MALGLPLVAQAAVSAIQPARTASATPGVLTLYSEPGLKGRHATYKATSLDVERQGFAAQSAASTGMWTLCEGGQVASRCQTVDGVAPVLKLSPQIVRPGLNALALYDQPGFKGRSIIYSFPADRPAPFHARSARTWGGAWSLCDRGYKDCRSIDGRSQTLDLVVAAVRPEPAAAMAQTPVALPVAALPHAPRPTHVAAHERAPAPAHAPRLTHTALAHSRPARTLAVRVRDAHARPEHPARRSLYVEVRERPRVRHEPPWRQLHVARRTRDEIAPRHPAHARLVRVSERRARHVHPVRRRLYRRIRLFWGGSDPYLYAGDPRVWGPPPPW
jgi:hypothetical protein